MPKLTQLKPRAAAEVTSTADVAPSEESAVIAEKSIPVVEETMPSSADSGKSTGDTVPFESKEEGQHSNEHTQPEAEVPELPADGAEGVSEPAAVATEE